MTKQRPDKPVDAPDDSAPETGAASSDEAAVMLQELRAELDEAVAARKRALADFVNYQKRAASNELRARHDGAAAVIRSLLGVLDHFDLALGHDPKGITAEQLGAGIRIVRDELLRVLESHGVTRIVPRPGDEFDPMRHEAVMRQAAEDIPANHVVMTPQAGYMLGDTVLRPAKVAVAPPAATEGP